MKKLYVLLFSFSLFIGMDAVAQQIRYVKEGGVGSGNSWTDASGDLQAMINASGEGDEVWVAKGMYKPNRKADALDKVTINNRFNAFVLRKNVRVYGGFKDDGSQTTKDSRDFVANETKLSGNIGDVNLPTDNVYHVVIASGDLGTNTVLDGFVVEDGYTEDIAGSDNSVGVNGYNIPSTRSPGIVIYYTSAVEFKNVIVRNNINASIDQHSAGSYVFYGTANFVDCKFLDNKTLGTSNASGGAAFVFGSSTRPGKVLFKNVEFVGNDARYGGALTLSTWALVDIENCKFVNNKANATTGGAIAILSSSTVANISNTVFESNTSVSNGGALYSEGSALVNIKDSHFEANAASGTTGGGAIYVSASLADFTIDRCDFINNTAASGAAINYRGSTAVLNMSRSNFIGNSATASGAAVYLSQTTSTINGCKFINNSAASTGGALFVLGSSSGVRTTPKIVNSLFYNNIGSSGGAVTVSTNSGPSFYNVTFYDNKTISNTGSGTVGHLFSSSAVANFNNCILWNSNSLTSNSRELSGQTSSPADAWRLTNCITKFYTNAVSTGVLNGQDPLFASVDYVDANFLELTATSPAIDKGDIALLPFLVEEDVYDKGRVYNGIIDLGALEFGGAAPIGPTVHNIDENTEVDVDLLVPNVSLLGNLISWDIISGNELGAFKINSATGMVTVANSEPLDFEARKQFVLIVQVSNGLDLQKVKLIVNVNNVMEDPQTPVIANVINGNVVTSYRPVLSGIAEANSTVVIFYKRNDGAVIEYTERSATDANGQWSFRFPAELEKGLVSFAIKTTSDLGTSEMSDFVTVNLKLYGVGGNSMTPTNILTPNNDGKNDVWIIEDLSLMYPNNEVVVYNKVGKIVFSQKNYQSNWDGTDKNTGDLLPAGTYYYQINIGTGLDRIKGTITIIRGR